MKKTLRSKIASVMALSVASVMAIGGLAACDSDADKDPNKLTFWFWGSTAEIQVYDKLIKQYEAEHPGITIASTHYESTVYMNNFKNQRKKPDVFFMPDTDFAAWADAGTMLDLTPYITQDEINSVWDEAIKEYRYDVKTKTLGTGALYGLPKDLGPVCLAYNKTLLDQQIRANSLDEEEVYALLNPQDPMTWQEFIDLGKSLTADQNKSSTDQIYVIPYYEMDAALFSNNTNYFDPTAKTGWVDKDEFIDAVWFNISLATEHHIMPSSSYSGGTDAYTRFFANKTIFTWMGPWDNADFWGYPNLKYDIIPVPYNGDNEEASSVSFNGSMCYGISSKTTKTELAVDFTKWLSMSTECQTNSMQLGQQVPNLKSMAQTFVSDDWTTDGANKNPKNRALFIDIIDGNTNSIGLYDSAADDKISGKTRSLYYTYDSTWKDNLMSYINDQKLWDATSRDAVASTLKAYKNTFQKAIDQMNKNWKRK